MSVSEDETRAYSADNSHDPLLPENQEIERNISNSDINNNGQYQHQRRKSLSDYYDGPTTNWEIFGWCLYSWATEPFIVSAVSTYVPLLLEQFARDSGVLAEDHSKSCTIGEPVEPVPPHTTLNTTATSSFSKREVALAIFSLAKRATNDTTEQKQQLHTDTKVNCVVNVFGKYIDPASFTLYVFSTSVFLQTLVVISITGFADKGNYKKMILLVFGFLGSLVTMGFYFLGSESYYKAGLYCILANICFGVVNVCGNSFLPILVENYKAKYDGLLTEQVQENNNNDNSDDNIGDSGFSGEQTIAEKSVVSSKISGLCSGLGYLAAFIVQILTMVIVIKTGSSVISIQYAILFVGIWWFLFQFPIIWLLKSRKVSSPISLTANFYQSKWNSPNPIVKKTYFFKEYVKIGWSNLILAFQQIRLLKDVCIFLLGWFVISDSVTTINSAAVLFSKTELNMKTSELAVIGILSILFAIAGTIIIPNYFNKHLQISLQKSLLIIILWSSFIPFYGILGFFFTSFGLKHKFEMYFLASWYGLSLGGLATVSRSLFGLLIPKGKESLFFALFAVTDKGSSIMGPFVVGLITDKTHNIRHCFWFLWALLVLSLPIFAILDTNRGKEEAERFDELVDKAEREAEERERRAR